MSGELKMLRERAEADPMPQGLEQSLADLIEPFTIYVEMEHDDAMQLLKLVWPAMKDWMFTQTVNWTPQLKTNED